MAGQTGIEWCDATFNPWWGCERVSPACAHCYADEWAARFGLQLWGAGHGFRFFGEKHWQEPLKWARTLPAKLGRRPRIFCASMADVFEERDELHEHRARLFTLIHSTPELDWLILTKRPEFARDWLVDFYELYAGLALTKTVGERVALAPGCTGFSNIWMGVSIENARFTWRADVLREIPAAVRFISAEPLLGSLFPTYDGGRDEIAARVPVLQGGRHGDDALQLDRGDGRDRADARGAAAPDPLAPEQEVAQGDAGLARGRAPLDLTGIDWVIVGGESGPRARPFHLELAREIVRAARERDVVCCQSPPAECCCRPLPTGECCGQPEPGRECCGEFEQLGPGPAVFVKQLGAKPIGSSEDFPASTWHSLNRPLADVKGGDWSEWPADLRVREFPSLAAVPV